MRFGIRKPPTPAPEPDIVKTAVAEIGASGLFDAGWYAAAYPDVAAAGQDPIEHYIRYGAAEGRSPGPNFSTLWYVSENPDAAAAGANPLLHFLEVGRAAGRSPVPLDEGQAFESFLGAVRSGALPFSDGLRSSIARVHFPLRPRSEPGADAGLPLPPVDLAVRIGSPTLDGFEFIGRGVKEAVARCLPDGFEFRNSRCLDFGCGVGRVIRFFAEEARNAEFWGCDIDGTSIRWAVENLTPPFRFFQMAAAPTLPFEDSSFDLIYAVSVFSQVFEDWHHWAVELRRILKPGGVLFMSFAGQTPFEEMLGLPYAAFDPNPGLYIRNPFNSWNRGGPMVFMSPGWVKRYWGSVFDIDFIAPDALLDYQSICVMRKPAPGSPPKADAPVVEVASRQAFDADATGKIFSRFDRDRPFLQSYGIEAAAGAVDIDGWIAFRNDAPERLDVTVGDAAVGSVTAWEPGANYRDWPGAPQTVFRSRLDAGAVTAGRHRLTVRIAARGGRTHAMSIPFRVL